MDAALRQFIWNRAAGVCEYCCMLHEFDPLPFCIDHIIAQQHHGPTSESNLALACYNCNSYKGPNIAGLDPHTRALARLFHPRLDLWQKHFEWHGPVLNGLTDTGRATIDVLQINAPERVEHRRLLIQEQVFPARS